MDGKRIRCGDGVKMAMAHQCHHGCEERPRWKSVHLPSYTPAAAIWKSSQQATATHDLIARRAPPSCGARGQIARIRMLACLHPASIRQPCARRLASASSVTIDVVGGGVPAWPWPARGRYQRAGGPSGGCAIVGSVEVGSVRSPARCGHESQRVVVRGSASEPASSTSRSRVPGAPNVGSQERCRSECDPDRWSDLGPGVRCDERSARHRAGPSRRPSAARKTGPPVRSPTARSIARAVRGASGTVITFPPFRGHDQCPVATLNAQRHRYPRPWPGS